MKKNFITQLLYFLSYFLLIAIYRDRINLTIIPFALGGLLGIILPYLDYFIYILVLKSEGNIPQAIDQQESSQKLFSRAFSMISRRSSEMDLIIHTTYFQIIFSIFSLFIVSTTTNFFARGIVLGFLLHLFIDQVIDLIEKKDIDMWFKAMPVQLDTLQKKSYIVLNGIILFIFGFFF